MLRIAHVINPFNAPAGSDLVTAQPITFESMRRAQAAAEGKAAVELWSVQFPEDRNMIPEGFRACADLERSVQDMARFEKPRKYPLITDILQGLHDSSDAEYLVYTNVDIALMPDFYSRVAERIQEGHDALIINRRRIPEHYSSVAQLEAMYQDKGKSHPGFDCFVFHRDLLPRFQLEGICIGVVFIGITLAQNLFCYAERFRLIDREHLTFHIGMELYMRRAPGEYLNYHRNAYRKCMAALMPDHDVRKLPYARLFWPWRWIKWGLHPSIPIKEALRLEWKRLSGR